MMALDPRQARLRADHDKLLTLQSTSPFVEILEVRGTPPEEYVLLLKCKGIFRVFPNGSPEYSETHRLKVSLHPSYPRRIPELQLLSPIWHPNINTQGGICLGHEGERGYVPSMTLADLVVQIIQIIRYENYSQQYYINLAAFNWAKKHTSLFPLDTSPIWDESLEIHILDASSQGDLLGEITIL
jgi:ubiquitin-protein ligase